MFSLVCEVCKCLADDTVLTRSSIPMLLVSSETSMFTILDPIVTCFVCFEGRVSPNVRSTVPSFIRSIYSVGDKSHTTPL